MSSSMMIHYEMQRQKKRKQEKLEREKALAELAEAARLAEEINSVDHQEQAEVTSGDSAEVQDPENAGLASSDDRSDEPELLEDPKRPAKSVSKRRK